MDYSDRLQRAMERAKKSRKALATALGISVAAVGQVINRQSKGFGLENNSKAAQFLGVSSDWLATGMGDSSIHTTQEAHAVSYLPFDDPVLTKEDLMAGGEKPARFIYALEDDSMGKFGKAGDQVLFDREKPWRVGSGVLVATSSGEVHVRRVAQGRNDGHWLAVPVNPLYRQLDSEQDGLTVIGVWKSNLDKGLEDA